ncbi:ATP-binding protein [Paraburkholderia nemoris]|uniref:ATP-binding protein n=1 Tax=Paraburkholderia nemoris TaxID=2793076 RepID=UPI0038B89534
MSDEYSPEWRKSQVLNHPLFSQTISGCLWTAPVQQVFQQVSRSTILRQSAYIEEATGKGKSIAMEFALGRVSQVVNGLACVNFNAQTNYAASVRAFFKEFLTALHHEKTTGETWDLRNRVRRKLEEVAVNSSSAIVILWVDEAQALNVTDFLFLRDVQNGLREIHADLLVFMTGEQPYLHRRIEEAKWSASPAIADRFAMKRMFLGGYGLDETRHLFGLIDAAVWPASSGITWTQFFFPKAFDAGFRLQSQAMACTSALESAKLLSRDGHCQARLLKMVVQRFMLDEAKHDAAGFIASPDAWRDAVSDSIQSYDLGANWEDGDDDGDGDGKDGR